MQRTGLRQSVAEHVGVREKICWGCKGCEKKIRKSTLCVRNGGTQLKKEGGENFRNYILREEFTGPGEEEIGKSGHGASAA